MLRALPSQLKSAWKDLRHTYATRLNARNGVGMKTIATLLGHTTTRMT